MLTNSERLSLAKNDSLKNFTLLLNECKTPFPTVIADTSHMTIVNAVTLEVEAALIGRFMAKLENYKDGIYEQEN